MFHAIRFPLIVSIMSFLFLAENIDPLITCVIINPAKYHYY